MLDTAEIPNWERWTVKEQTGINRGCNQDYINTNRADHVLVIRTGEDSHAGEYRAVVNPEAGGGWKSPGGDDTTRFEGDSENATSLLAEAEAYARDWMENHPCERNDTNTPRDAVELLTDLFSGLRSEGLTIQHDMDVNGWTPANRRDSTTHNMRPVVCDETGECTGTNDPSAADALVFNIGLDGKHSGLSYREYTERDSGGETRRMHEPRNQSVLHEPITKAFHAVGFEDVSVRNGGYQAHWDHSISYRVTASIPSGFDLAFPTNLVESSR